MSWTDKIQKGDVLKFQSGKLRVVRSVTHSVGVSGKRRTSVSFSILHCSWTHRPYTSYSGSDLRTLGVRPTKARLSLRKKVDKAIEREMFGREDGSGYPTLPAEQCLSCCDVLRMGVW